MIKPFWRGVLSGLAALAGMVAFFMTILWCLGASGQ